MRRPVLGLVVALVLAAAGSFPVAAQDRAKTLADIRQDLSVLYVEIQRLKRELSTTGGAGVSMQGTGLIERVDGIEAEVRRLTEDVEETRNMVERVVTDGTNRIGDLEFRLVELEGGDVGQLGETTTLGGVDVGAVTPPALPAPDAGGAQLAIGEQADFDAAQAALGSGDYQTAADRFGQLIDSYPGTPLTQRAQLGRGRALMELGQTGPAARAFLESYSVQPDGPDAPDALLRLGLALDGLGQRDEACITLAEVTTRFPNAPQSVEAQTARADRNCF